MLANDGTLGGVPVRPLPPVVRVVEVRLAHQPTDAQLAAYYCAQYASRTALGAFGALACRVLGPIPTPDQLRLVFDVELEAENTNKVPLPMVQALVAFRAFPSHPNAPNLGAVCLSLCQDPMSCPQNQPDACRSDEPEIRDLNDFTQAAAGLLVSVALGQRRFEDLRIRTITPGDKLRFVTQLSLDVDQALRLIELTARQAVEQAKRGNKPHFTIPYTIDGSVWVSVEGFGRIAASFPQIQGAWELQR
jgi:hypothetical protein